MTTVEVVVPERARGYLDELMLVSRADLEAISAAVARSVGDARPVGELDEPGAPAEGATER